MKKTIFLVTVTVVMFLVFLLASITLIAKFVTSEYQKSLEFEGTTTDITEQINTFRALHDLEGLQENAILNEIAEEKCKDMVIRGYFDHLDPDHQEVYHLFKKYNLEYGYAGENIAQGQTSAAQVAREWYASPGHKANIVFSQFTEVGHAICSDGSTYKVVQVFKG